MKLQAWTNPKIVDVLQQNYTNVFSTDRIIGNCSTEYEMVSFGFSANLLRILNEGAVSVFIDLNASSAITTGYTELAAGARLEMSVDAMLSGFTTCTVTTSAGGQSLSVLALGNT